MKKFQFKLQHVLLNSLFFLIASMSFNESLIAQNVNLNLPGTFESLQSQNALKNQNSIESRKREPAVSNSTASTLSISEVGLQQVYSSTGQYTLSVDGIGSLGASMSIRVNKPNAQATVQKAILISSATQGTIANGCITIAGVPVNWNGSAASGIFNNYWADVTSIVAAQINGFPAGISSLGITECNTSTIEGEVLLVVFNDPTATEKTVIIMFGAQNPAGDNFSVTLAQPIDPNESGALLDMGLGIGFGYQATFGGGQTSHVSVNNQRITSSAGGEDDGASANGALITVGGIGDVNTNPSNPLAGPTNFRSDDELYNILPFITNTTTSLNINTVNPSGDDNIFLAYFALSGAAIIGEGVLLSQTTTSGDVGTDHTVKAAVLNSIGQPVANRLVTFTITSGPNAGGTFSTTTDADGNAFYTYTGSGGSGIDNIQACFTNSQNQNSCSNTVSFEWLASATPTISTDALVTSAYCVGSNVPVNYTSVGNFNATNTFTAQLSDPSGDFTVPTDIGSVTATTSGSINATVPLTTPAGTGYRIRVVSSDPAIIGSDNGSDITIGTLPTVTIPNVMVLPSGTNQNTLYIGYGPASQVTLNAQASGGGGTYTYLWAPGGSTSSTLLVNANTLSAGSHTYTVTISDGIGCTATTSIQITVVDIRCGKNLDKVKLCHKDNSNARKELCISSDGVADHLAHGDNLGVCPAPSALRQITAPAEVNIKQSILKASVYPNPTSNYFTLKLNSSSKEKIMIRVVDIYGKVIELRSGVANTSYIRLGDNYKSGIYFVEVVQGNKTERIKMIKRN